MTFYEKLEAICQKYSTEPAFGDAYGMRKTYLEFLTDVQAYMHFFEGRREKRIAVMGAPSYLWMCHVYGAVSVGKTVALVDPLLPVEDMQKLLNNADVALVFHDEPDAAIENMLGEQTPAIGYMELAPMAGENVATQAGVKHADGEIMLFTSGTSNMAKGAVFDAESYWDSVGQVEKIFSGDVLKKVLVPLPLHHIYASSMTLLYLMQGRCVYFGSVRRLKEELQRIEPQELLAVGSLVEYILGSGCKPESLKCIAVSGSACDKKLEERAALVGCRIQNVYGATEIGGVGFSLPGFSVDHLTPARGLAITIDEDGIIWMDSKYHFREYYKAKEKSDAIFQGSKFTLGDVGEWNDDGTFNVLGRRENIVAMNNGDKLYLNEMEEQINQLEGIEESCILYLEKQVVAVIVAKNEEVEKAESSIKNYNKKQPIYRKISKTWIRTDKLPRTNIGKVKRSSVALEYQER